MEASRFFKEENVTIIHNILKEEIVIQDKNTQLISVNLKITWKKISSLEFTESMLEAKVKNLEVWCESMKIELQVIYVHQKDPEYICRPGICNLQIDGVAKRKSLTWEQCEDEVQNIFKVNLNHKNIDIERVHCWKGKKSSKPRTIVL